MSSTTKKIGRSICFNQDFIFMATGNFKGTVFHCLSHFHWPKPQQSSMNFLTLYVNLFLTLCNRFSLLSNTYWLLSEFRQLKETFIPHKTFLYQRTLNCTKLISFFILFVLFEPSKYKIVISVLFIHAFVVFIYFEMVKIFTEVC